MQIFETRESWYSHYLENWLAHYQQTGATDWKIYQRPKNETPVQGKGIDLAHSRLVLISTAGGYLHDSQTPFDAENDLGDYTIRLFPSSTPLEALSFAHTHYDHTAVDADPQVLVPLRHLEDLVREGVIGEIASMVVSYMGYQPDATRTVDVLFPAVLDAVRSQQAQGALLVPS